MRNGPVSYPTRGGRAGRGRRGGNQQSNGRKLPSQNHSKENNPKGGKTNNENRDAQGVKLLTHEEAGTDCDHGENYEWKQTIENKQANKKKTIKVTDKSVAIAWTVLSVLNGQRQI